MNDYRPDPSHPLRCPVCGGTSWDRPGIPPIEDAIHLDDHMRLKKRHGPGRQPNSETLEGDDFHENTQSWNWRFQSINRSGNMYFEIVIDPDSGMPLKVEYGPYHNTPIMVERDRERTRHNHCCL